MTEHYTHASIPCAVLDVRAHLPPDERIARVPDIFDQYRIQLRKTVIHLEMRMEMLKAEEEREQRS